MKEQRSEHQNVQGRLGRRASMLGLAVAAALASSAGHAQQSIQAEGTQVLEEITVTAQRRVENLQNVPIAATVLTGEMLRNKEVNNIVDLQYAAPGFTVANYGSANVLNIRGIGRSAVDIELPSGVVLYRDGFPTFPGYFQNEPYYDIESIEVLRGAQGTVAGKSAAGGAVMIRTNGPDLSAFNGNFEAELANYQAYGFQGMVNAPISDTFGVRGAAYYYKRDDYLVDSLTGPYVGRPDEPELISARVGALWEPSDKLSAEFRLDGSDLNFGGNITTSYGHSLRDVENNANFKYRDRSWRAVANVRYTFDNDLLLTSVTGWQRVHTDNNFDRNGSDPAFNRFDSQGVFELYSQEFNLISPEDAGRLSYVLGIFAQRTESDIYDWRGNGFNIYLVDGDPYPTITLDTPYLKKEDEYSAFVDMKYALTDRFDVQLGLRYSNYDLWSDINVVFQLVPNEPPTFPIYVGKPELDEDNVDGKLALIYNLGLDSNLYAIVAKGHINGGFNIVGGFPFDEEEIWSYELGWKGNWADGHVRTQLSAYYQTLSDFQAQFASADLPNQNILQNASGDSTITGVEFSMQALLGNLHVDLAAAFLDSELGDFPDVVDPTVVPQTVPATLVNLTGGTAPFAPEISVNVGASYDFVLASGHLFTPRIDVSYVSDQNGAVFESPRTLIPERTLVNAALRYDTGSWYAEAFGTNLGDKRYVSGVQDIGNIWYPGAPRQYGVRAGWTF